ncbi:MAG: malate dehydrogenase [Campylobacterota bacterium]|nr:malate dehydrogenase [Campylobacterota bacterium]
MSNRKVGIIGAGAVGASAAFSLVITGSCTEIVLYDIQKDAAIGKAIDLEQACAYSPSGTIVTAAHDPSDVKDCDIVVITAGVPRKGDMTREDLLMINAKIMKDVVGNIKKYSPNAKIICVSNPLDVMTYVVHKMTGWDKNRIIGMAGALDSSRMAYQINNHIDFGRAQTKAMVIGDHGENMIPVPSLSSVGGVPLTEIVSTEDMEKIIDRTKNGGAQIVKHLGTSAYYAPGRSVAVMVEAILDDSKIVIPSSVLLDGEYGHKDVTVGVPVVVGKNGIESIIELELDDELSGKFTASVNTIKEGIKVLENNNFFDN